MRYLLVLLLAGCVASQWTKEGANAADEDRDYEDCRKIATSDPVIPALFGVFGAVGVFFGVNHKDSNIRSCMEGRGWNRNSQNSGAGTF